MFPSLPLMKFGTSLCFFLLPLFLFTKHLFLNVLTQTTPGKQHFAHDPKLSMSNPKAFSSHHLPDLHPLFNGVLSNLTPGAEWSQEIQRQKEWTSVYTLISSLHKNIREQT